MTALAILVLVFGGLTAVFVVSAILLEYNNAEYYDTVGGIGMVMMTLAAMIGIALAICVLAKGTP